MRRQVTTIIAVVGLALGPASIATAEPFSPDARDANVAAQQSQPARSIADPRSPDARDAATVLVIPSGVIAHTGPVSVANPQHDGFGWDDAGIGAAGLAVLALLALGAGVGIQHHRRQPAAPLVG